jgi:hypothetical protein
MNTCEVAVTEVSILQVLQRTFNPPVYGNTVAPLHRRFVASRAYEKLRSGGRVRRGAHATTPIGTCPAPAAGPRRGTHHHRGWTERGGAVRAKEEKGSKAWDEYVYLELTNWESLLVTEKTMTVGSTSEGQRRRIVRLASLQHCGDGPALARPPPLRRTWSACYCSSRHSRTAARPWRRHQRRSVTCG